MHLNTLESNKAFQPNSIPVGIFLTIRRNDSEWKWATCPREYSQRRASSATLSHVALKLIFTCLTGEGPSELRPVELDVVAAAGRPVGGPGFVSVSFTFPCRLARCLLDACSDLRWNFSL